MSVAQIWFGRVAFPVDAEWVALDLPRQIEGLLGNTVPRQLAGVFGHPLLERLEDLRGRASQRTP